MAGLLLVGPYNDFLSEDGKLWPRLREVPEEAHALHHQTDDVVIKEHWAQSGFTNTDLDHQFRQRGIDNV